jgi:5-formyltetrahydrofolate cyclo-ligase
MTLQKEFYRKKMKANLNSLQNSEHGHLSNQIANKLFNTYEWQRANTIGVTISRGKEINTNPVIKRAWEEGKQVAVPKCLPKTKEMEFRVFSNYNQLEVVYYGLQEPKKTETTMVQPPEIDLLIVPGLIYDLKGYRIGFGGGYFDRYLVNYPNQTVALALELQLMEEIPVESFDIPVQKVVTEKRILHTNAN